MFQTLMVENILDGLTSVGTMFIVMEFYLVVILLLQTLLTIMKRGIGLR